MENARVAPKQQTRPHSAVIKSLMTPKSHRKDKVSNEARSPSKNGSAANGNSTGEALPLNELKNGQDRKWSPQKEQSSKMAPLHKKTKSAISFKGLKGKDNPKENRKSMVDQLARDFESGKIQNSSNKRMSYNIEDRENKPPSRGDEAPPPIWAQFQTQASDMPPATPTTPSDPFMAWSSVDATSLSKPQPPKKDNRAIEALPQITPGRSARGRPLSGKFTTSFGETLTKLQKKQPLQTGSSEPNEKGREKSRSRQSSRAQEPKSEAKNRGTKVMAAVAAFSGSSDQTPKLASTKGAGEIKLDAASIEEEFEAVLKQRNITGETADKMRGMDSNVKAEFIKQQKKTASPQKPANSRASSKSRFGKRERGDDCAVDANIDTDAEASPKKQRSRSFNLSFGKRDSSPSKKQKSGRSTSHGRNKSADIPRSSSSKSLSSLALASGGGFFGLGQNLVTPQDFISYLKKVPNPKEVEVGRIQKLRQVLRNEEVEWVDEFITKGGMAEVVHLLYRILDIEWREEHEDNLLHHTLNCLKGLLTTSRALQQLDAFHAKLFPDLLKLLFSAGDDRKAPSEYTTRHIMVTLIFAYLQHGASGTLESRANTILGYLRDPKPADSEQPHSFITDMHRPRPYKLWYTEVSSVTKEVFWIFLHHLNVIPMPPPSSSHPPHLPYATRHFPRPHAPVAAAPYVGGVEWDASNYLAAHLDLLNALLAALPAARERNALRAALRDSGFERAMGADLRTCKEKFYGCVHAALAAWVAAAAEDGWDVAFVREGPRRRGRRGGGGGPALGEVKF